MAISFACQNIDFKDVIMCSFSLNKTEYALLIFLLGQQGRLSATSIGKHLNKDRTTVQKAIKKLVDTQLVSKYQINLESGGYTFVYAVKEKEELRRRILQIVQAWSDNVVAAVKSW